jgi:hypothetical protein
MKIFQVLTQTVILLSFLSCNKMKDYFRDPDTDVLIETVHSATLTGYAANIAMAVMNGQNFQNVSFSRTGTGYPCTTIMVIDLTDESGYSYTVEKADAITIAGLWADSTTAILSMLYTDYHRGSEMLDLVGIETIPVIREGNCTHVAMANQDIKLNPDQQSILSIDLNTLEIESEYFRLDVPRATDVYVAVAQDAYLIDIYNQGTLQNTNDDEYVITGGGQLVEVTKNTAEIVQLAMIEVKISPDCEQTPVDGMSLIRVTGLENQGFPELGTALLEFNNNCNSRADVFVATGMYIGSNGSSVPFSL